MKYESRSFLNPSDLLARREPGAGDGKFGAAKDELHLTYIRSFVIGCERSMLLASQARDIFHAIFTRVSQCGVLHHPQQLLERIKE